VPLDVEASSYIRRFRVAGHKIKKRHAIYQSGSTGLKVSRICLGAMTYGSKSWREWVLEEEESRPLSKRALDLGIKLFDTADVYSLGVSERF